MQSPDGDAERKQQFEEYLAALPEKQQQEIREKLDKSGLDLEQFIALLQEKGADYPVFDETGDKPPNKGSEAKSIVRFILFVILMAALIYSVKYVGGNVGTVILILLALAVFGIFYGLYRLVRFIVRLLRR